jgi:holo-[acyl-carrier protein] synthase
MDPPEAARLPAAFDERAEALARAIALKEAASKALGTGWSRGVRWRDVEVLDGPDVRLRAGAARRAAALGSPGACAVRLRVQDGLVIGEVWLLGTAATR